MTDSLAEAARALLDAYFPKGCMNAEAHTLREALAEFDAQGPGALEEKAAALDWLLGKLNTTTVGDVRLSCRHPLVNDVRVAVSHISFGSLIGTGPTPLTAVLDAMKKEVKS